MTNGNNHLTDEEHVYLVESGQLPGSSATAEELGLVPEEGDKPMDEERIPYDKPELVAVYDSPSGKGMCAMCTEDVGPCEGPPCVNAGLDVGPVRELRAEVARAQRIAAEVEACHCSHCRWLLDYEDREKSR